MKLKPNDMIELPKHMLRIILKALSFTHLDAANYCGLSRHAVSRWRTNGRMPRQHAETLSNALLTRLKEKPESQWTLAQTIACRFLYNLDNVKFEHNTNTAHYTVDVWKDNTFHLYAHDLNASQVEAIKRILE